MIDSAAVLVAYLIHVVRHVLNIALALRVYASHTDVDTPKLTALVTYAPCEYVRAIDVSGIRAHDAMTKKKNKPHESEKDILELISQGNKYTLVIRIY